MEEDESNYYQNSEEEEDLRNDESMNNSDSANPNRGPYERAWTTEATRALIHIRGPMEDQFAEGRAKRTMLWIQVTKQLHKMGFRYSAAKVQKKWHNILITYNKNISRKEENGTITWEFFEDMYIYLKGKKAKPEFSSEGYSTPTQQSTPKVDYQAQLQKQMQQQHQRLQKQRAQMLLERQKHFKREKQYSTNGTNQNASTSYDYYNDSSHIEDTGEIKDEEDVYNKRHFEDVNNLDEDSQPKPKRQMNGMDEFMDEESPMDRLPLEISHVEGGGDETDNFEKIMLDNDPFMDDWWKDYCNKKLETDKEKVELQKRMHRDVMNYNKMCLIQQERIERIKIEAINNLTATLQRLVENKANKRNNEY